MQGVPYTPEPPKKSSKTWLIVLIVVLVLCCLCVVLIGAFYYVFRDQFQNSFNSSILVPSLLLAARWF